MLVAPRYEGLDLPVHDPETFVATWMDTRFPQSFEQVVEGYTVSTFVKAMMIQLNNLSHAPGSAAELLEKTDQELEKVAELCGALVAGYEWGLYPVEGKDQHYKRYLPAAKGLGGIITLPKNHILVAEVDTIKPAPLAERNALNAVDTERYYREGRGTYQLLDARRRSREGTHDQFIYGTPVGSSEEQPAAHLIDIEPRFSLTR